MDEIDRAIINRLQQNMPVCERPYAIVAEQLGIDEQQLMERLQTLLETHILSRFGPMYDVEKMGGAFSLVAMQVPANEFDGVAAMVNGLEEVAHNYQRDHTFNMWYVLATETADQIDVCNDEIEKRTGLKTFNMPKLREYYIGLKLDI